MLIVAFVVVAAVTVAVSFVVVATVCFCNCCGQSEAMPAKAFISLHRWFSAYFRAVFFYFDQIVFFSTLMRVMTLISCILYVYYVINNWKFKLDKASQILYRSLFFRYTNMNFLYNRLYIIEHFSF